MTITGRCLCGNVTYRAESDPVVTILCHCDDCQRHSGAAFSTNVIVPSADFTIEGSAMKTHGTVSGDGGHDRGRVFCGECGSTLITTMADMDNLVVIKAGTLDDRSWVSPQMEIWTDSAQAWVHAADAPERRRFPRSLQM